MDGGVVMKKKNGGDDSDKDFPAVDTEYQQQTRAETVKAVVR